MRERTTRERLQAFIDSNGYKRAPARISLEVWQAKVNRKERTELTIGATVACLYNMVGSRRSLVRVWDVVKA